MMQQLDLGASLSIGQLRLNFPLRPPFHRFPHGYLKLQRNNAHWQEFLPAHLEFIIELQSLWIQMARQLDWYVVNVKGSFFVARTIPCPCSHRHCGCGTDQWKGSAYCMHDVGCWHHSIENGRTSAFSIKALHGGCCNFQRHFFWNFAAGCHHGRWVCSKQIAQLSGQCCCVDFCKPWKKSSIHQRSYWTVWSAVSPWFLKHSPSSWD